MILKYFIVFTFVGLSYQSELPHIETHIIGGTEVNNLTEFSYQAFIRYADTESLICGAVIYSQKVLITAAHCITDLGNIELSDIEVVVGSLNSYNLTSNASVYHLEKIIIHKDYNTTTYNYADISLLFLKEGKCLEWSSSVSPITLGTEEPEAGTVATISGWGSIALGQYPYPYLLFTEVPIVNTTECAEIYGKDYITESNICAGNVKQGGDGPCQGDSGGPLTVNETLVGIISWGNDCALAGYPGVYTNIAYFVDWIHRNADS